MSTFQDFESAPVGATATAPNGNIALKTGRRTFEWSIFDSRGNARDNHPSDEMGFYILNPAAPTNSREALDLAWKLAHPVKEGQVIPKDTRYLGRYSEPTQEFIATDDIEIAPWLVGTVRTLDRLPEPVPEWTKAPAVLATCRYSDETREGVFTPSSVHPDRWVLAGTVGAMHWSDLADVTPLYPKEDNGGMYITGSGDIQFKDRNGQIVWEV